MYKLKVWLRHYFGLTSHESNGFIAVAAILFLLIFVPSIYHSFIPEGEIKEAGIILLKADSLIVERESQEARKPTVLFAFDPNTATEVEFTRLGIKPAITKRILKYRSKRGRFKEKDDFSKIYGLNFSQYETLKPYIIFNSEIPVKNKSEALSVKIVTPVSRQKEDLNQADTAALRKANGIGNVLALRIIKYRNRIGGFASTDQLKEVYGLDTSVVARALQKFFIDSSSIRKLNINTISADSLALHPYIGKKAARILINYRSNHGTYKTVGDVSFTKALEDDKLKKLAPYLSF